MKIKIENLGVFRWAEYELSDLTIICGKNNTGKTYATYALFGFLDFFRHGFYIKIQPKFITQLLEQGTTTIPIDETQEIIDRQLNLACEIYTKFLSKVFAGQKRYFENAKFQVKIDASEVIIPDKFENSYRTNRKDFLQIIKTESKHEMIISLLLKDNEIEETVSLKKNLIKIIGDAMKNILFDNVLRECFIASAERTGAVIFKDELNFQKNTLLREVANAEVINIEDIVDKIYSTNYALPVRRNIDFIRNLDSISKSEGVLCQQHPELLDIFNDIVGGTYKVSSRDGILYSPVSAKATKLTIGESASSVRSLLDINFYLRYIARPNQILMIDEPELNLHPESQRKLARLIARLVKVGVKVFITTHSDYIVKEFNTLLMFNARKDNGKIKQLMQDKGYEEQELLNSEQIKVYISDKTNVLLPGHTRRVKCQSLIEARIDPYFGIEARSFDNTIREMNSIQESIMFSGYGHRDA